MTNLRYSVSSNGVNCDISGCMEELNLKSKLFVDKNASLDSSNVSPQINISSRKLITLSSNFLNVGVTSDKDSYL